MRGSVLGIAVPLLVFGSFGCSSGDEPLTTGGTGGGGGAPPIGGDRPVTVYVPSGYNQAVPTPLVILLHGYSASGLVQELYFQLEPLAEERGFLYAHPDGTVDSTSKRYWDATDACCAFAGTPVDDSAYLAGVVDDIKAAYNVDPKRVFFLGHSNGGFMSYRMACDHADTIAAIASLAGAMWDDTSKCTPSEPVSVLQIHGTADATVLYDGGLFAGHPYPSAETSVLDWATYDGCALQSTAGADLDLDSSLPGAETTVARYADGCDPGGAAELWTIAGGGHIPSLSPDFAPAVVDFLFAHPKP